MVHGSLTTPDPAPQTRHGAQRGKRVSRDHRHVLGERRRHLGEGWGAGRGALGTPLSAWWGSPRERAASS